MVDPRPVIGLLGTGAALDELALDMAPAPLRYTGNPLDIAVDGPGFFAVETGTGQVAYTRDGRMTVGADGFLRTTSGFLVLGVDGPIPVGEGVPAIDETGQVYVNGEVVGQLALWEFAEPRALARLGDNLLAPSEGSGEPLRPSRPGSGRNTWRAPTSTWCGRWSTSSRPSGLMRPIRR